VSDTPKVSPEVVQKRRETLAKCGEGELVEKCTPELPLEEQFEPEYHEADSTGFPDGEGDVVEASYFVEEIVHTGAAAREQANEWDEAIREAAGWILEDIVSYEEEDANTTTKKAFNAILYKLQWVAQTGQGMRDIV